MNDSRSRLQFTAAAFLFGTNGLLAAYIPLTGAQTVLLRTVLGSLFLAAAVALTGRFDIAALKAGRRRRDRRRRSAGAQLGAAV